MFDFASRTTCGEQALPLARLDGNLIMSVVLSMGSMHRDSNEVGSHLGLHRLATGNVTIPSGLLLCSVQNFFQRDRANAEHRWEELCRQRAGLES